MTTTLPHPPRRLPLVGDVIGASQTTAVRDSLRYASELGPIFERKILGQRVVIVSGADLAGELCDEKRFSKYVNPAISALRGLGGDGLFTAFNEEPNWAKAHALLAPAFTKSAMHSYHDVMLDVFAELEGWWANKDAVDVSADMTRLTLETIGRTAMGYGFHSFENSDVHPFVSAMVRALAFAQKSGLLSQSRVGRMITARGARQNASDEKYVLDLVDDVIATRRVSPEPHPNDLLELMLRAAQDHPELAIDEQNIRYQLVTFLVAGHETTSGALSLALYYLSQNPEVLARAREEVDSVWGSVDRPAYDQVAKLRYVRRVLDETLRLWPTAPAFGRQAREDTTIGGRYEMRAGEWALVFLPGLHRDPVWGENTDEFDPDRFEPSRVRSRPAHAYKPFGTGERACIGRQFAVHEAVLILGKILQRYDLRPDPGYRLELNERLTLMPSGFEVTVTPRRKMVRK
ncbi:cytochrome P450 [Rhodococcoides trifolii]|uniref:Cytochrome P450 n=1 Tax=Rhodococcoides trifolii TaxID=908250 RepID=A0A917CU10_9NOCA|nr:cytochrome P450 [Rhodococcus trifolii]GGF98177.1 cytochrome P450 [Rhodococcus trifolii]